MDDPISGPAGVLLGLLHLRETVKLRRLLEANAKATVKPALVAKPRRKSRPKKRRQSAATIAAVEERRRERLKLEREKHEWRKKRDMANAAKWFVEWVSDDYDH